MVQPITSMREMFSSRYDQAFAEIRTPGSPSIRNVPVTQERDVVSVLSVSKREPLPVFQLESLPPALGGNGESAAFLAELQVQKDRLVAHGLPEQGAYQAIYQNFLTADYLRFLAETYGATMPEVFHFLDQHRMNEYHMVGSFNHAASSLTDLIKFSYAAKAHPHRVSTVLHMLGRQRSREIRGAGIPSWLRTPEFLEQLMGIENEMGPDRIEAQAVLLCQQYQITLDIAYLLIACRQSEAAARVKAEAEAIRSRYGLLYSEAFMSVLGSWDTDVQAQVFQRARTRIDPRQYQPCTFYNPSQIESRTPYVLNLIFSSALAGRVRFNSFLKIRERTGLFDLARQTARTARAEGRGNCLRTEYFFEVAVWELLKNAHRYGNNSQALLAWEIDPMSGQVLVRVINRGESVYQPDAAHLSRYRGWNIDEIEADIIERESALPRERTPDRDGVDPFERGGVGRGVSIARYYADDLSYGPVFLPDGTLYGTVATAKINLLTA